MSTINLLPDDYLKKRSQRRANVVCGGLFLVVMLAVGVGAIMTERRVSNTIRVQRQVNQEYANAARLVAEMHELEKSKRVLLEKAEDTAKLMERVPRSYLLGLVTNARPEGLVLKSVKLKTRRRDAIYSTVEPKKKGGPVRRKGAVEEKKLVQPAQQWVEMTLTGVARTDAEVAKYIASLATNSLVGSVDLGHTKETTSNEQKVRQFEVLVQTVPNADVIDVVGAPEDNAQLARQATR
jgi:Tfp pilus assembly protein PilN